MVLVGTGTLGWLGVRSSDSLEPGMVDKMAGQLRQCSAGSEDQAEGRGLHSQVTGWHLLYIIISTVVLRLP